MIAIIVAAFVALVAYLAVCLVRAQLSERGGAARWLRLFTAAVREGGRP